MIFFAHKSPKLADGSSPFQLGNLSSSLDVKNGDSFGKRRCQAVERNRPFYNLTGIRVPIQ